MHDFVDIALTEAKDDGATEQSRWEVTFVTNETRSGIIELLGHGAYKLKHSTATCYYFNSDKVVYMRRSG